MKGIRNLTHLMRLDRRKTDARKSSTTSLDGGSMNAPRSIRQRLRERFLDKRYRRVYVEDFLNTSIAAQIQALRKARKLSQKQLASKIGTKQNGISRLEDVNYTGWRVGTLKKLARAFDVVLVVRFESFGSALNDIASFSKQSLLVPSFDEDPVFTPEKPRVAYPSSAPPWPAYALYPNVGSGTAMVKNSPVHAAMSPGMLLGARLPRWSEWTVAVAPMGGSVQ
jgi:transcriptional regulator with XRE-family HTH domain